MINSSPVRGYSAISTQKGLSLIELMIAMVLGLFIIAGVISIFIASNKSTKYSDGLRSMQENGRQAVFVLQSAIRQAGYSSDKEIMAVDLAKSGTTRIAVRAESTIDCTGTSTASAPEPGIAVNSYFLDVAAKQIMCSGSIASSTPIPVADNIEAFQILYGIDVDKNGVVEQFVRHAEIPNAFDITSIQIGILVVTDSPVKDKTYSKTYYVLDGSKATNDLFGRQVFRATVNIRNKAS